MIVSCDCLLDAVAHVERLDPALLHKGRICDGRLPAADDVKRLNPTQVHKGCVRDGRLEPPMKNE